MEFINIFILFYFKGSTPPTLTRKNSLNRSPVLPPKTNKSSSPVISRKSSHIEPKSINSLNEKGITEKILPSVNIAECVTPASPRLSVFEKLEVIFEPTGCFKEKDDYSLYLFSPNNRQVFRSILRTRLKLLNQLLCNILF